MPLNSIQSDETIATFIIDIWMAYIVQFMTFLMSF